MNPTIPGYDLGALLGQGGFGRVFEATEVSTGRLVALKLLDNVRVGLLGRLRFEREFSLLRKLDHPVLAGVFACGESHGASYFTMERVHGQDLRSYFAPLSLPEKLQAAGPVFGALLSALEYVHSHGILHRDMKPQNVLVQANGKPRLLDFGTAREADAAELTQTGSWTGTPRYMAPEQIQGEELDERADLYGLGATLWECLTGEPLFGAADSAAMFYKVLHEPAPRLPAGFPLALQDLLQHLLEKKRSLRPPSVSAVRTIWSAIFPDCWGSLGVSAVPAPARVFSTPLVGRQAEMEQLAETLLDGQALVLLEGSSGVGKTRLLRELQTLAQREKWQCTRLACHQGDLPYRPLVSAYRPRLAAGIADAFRPALAQLFPELGSFPHDPAMKLSLFEGLRSLVNVSSPNLLLVDDAQQADAGTAEFLRYLAGNQDDPPLVIVLSGTFDREAHRWMRLGAKSIRLEPLSRQEARELILLATGASDLSEARLQELWEETSGNPLFLLEILKAQADPSGALPRSLEEAIQRRWTGLSEQAQETAKLLQACAPADFSLLLEASDLPSEALLDAIEELRGRRLVRVDRERSTYDFECSLVRRAAPARPGVRVHERLARALEKRHATSEVVAAHFVAAGLHDQAAGHLQRAGEERCSSYDYAGALQFWEQATLARPELAGGLAQPKADAQAMMSDYPSAVEAYEKLLGEARGMSRVTLLRKLAICKYRYGDLRGALGKFHEAWRELGIDHRSSRNRLKTFFGLVWHHRPSRVAMPEAAAREYLECVPYFVRALFFSRPPGWLIDHLTATLIQQDLCRQLVSAELGDIQREFLLGLRAQAFPFLGGSRAAVRHFTTVAELARKLPDSSFRMLILRDAGCFLIVNGDYSSRSVLEDAERMAAERNDWNEYVMSCSLLSVVDTLTGCWKQARQRLERLEQLSQLSHNQADRLMLVCNRVLLASLTGQSEEAESWLAQAREFAAGVQANFFQVILEVVSVWALIGAGRWQEALTQVRRTRKQCQSFGLVDLMREGELCLMEGWAWVELQAQGPHDPSALQAFLDRFEQMTRKSFAAFEPSALRLQARLLELRGEVRPATERFQRCLQRAQEVGNFLEQSKASQALARLKKLEKVPARVGPYEIVGKLGEGGMAEVFLARRDGREVALKRILTSCSWGQDEKRFQREIKICRELDHPNLIRLLDDGEHEGWPYLVMEYLQGQSLRAVLKEKRTLQWRQAVEILIQALDGVAAAHSRGIAHRDLKPDNLQVLPDGTVKVLDFGVARGDDFTVVTEAGAVMGSLQYLAPEQIQGSLATTCDQYALGIVLYEMLSGSPPFGGSDVLRIASQHINEAPPPLKIDVPLCLQMTLERMLRKSPAARFRDLDSARARLSEVLEGKPEAEGEATEAFEIPAATL